MKQTKRTNQFKIRVSDDFMNVLNVITKQRMKSQSDIIHIALAEYSRKTIRDYLKNEKYITNIENTSNTRKPRIKK